jgi:Ca-activated chloride channel family protein
MKNKLPHISGIWLVLATMAMVAAVWFFSGCANSKSASNVVALTEGAPDATPTRAESSTPGTSPSPQPTAEGDPGQWSKARKEPTPSRSNRSGVAGFGSRHPASPLAFAADSQLAATAQTPLPDEEIWVIARGSDVVQQSADDSPGSGALMAKIEQKEIPMPLKHTDVRANVSGYIGEVEVTQQFHNPYSSKIEAVYLFPLPHNAAVNDFIMTIGERRIRGIIRERKEAEEIYQEAKRQGYVASLLTEERPNIFTQSVANIEPGQEIDVNIKYLHTLSYVDGWYEFVFPMVVGPRFNPAGMTEGVGAVSRGKSGVSGQSKEVSYLAPQERTAHDISLSVNIDAGVRIEEFECKTHETIHELSAPERLTVSLNPGDSLPNRDFVLRYRVAGEQIKSSLLTHKDQRGGFFSLMLYPPRELESLPRQPMEMVFVIDCSGSMDGRPIAQAKAAVERGLSLLQSGDSFQVISFSMSASKFGERPLGATRSNVKRAIAYVESLNGEGGTMMIEGIKAALDFPHDPQRLRFVCFLTDGYIGNEAEILSEIRKRLGPSRIFSFGIGSAVNRYLIEHMGKTGRGAVAFLGLNDDAAQIMEDFFERISHPALTDVRIDWGGLRVAEVFPGQLPDLFVGRPLVVTGRFRGDATTPIRLSGNAGGEQMQFKVPVTATGTTGTNGGLASIWARMKIAELAEQSVYKPNPNWAGQIKKVALDYNLMSSFTAFIAVDSTRRTAGNAGTTVPVSVPVPEGVKYETTVTGE